MSNYGLKISKIGKDISSNLVRDYIFNSKYQSLQLLYKAQVTINVSSSSSSGTATYTHNLGFFPLVIGVTTSKSTGSRLIFPIGFNQGGSYYCNKDSLSENFNLKIKINTVDIIYNVYCYIPQIGSRNIDIATSYVVDLYFFMFELGSLLL